MYVDCSGALSGIVPQDHTLQVYKGDTGSSSSDATDLPLRLNHPNLPVENSTEVP